MTEIKVPTLGESVTEATVARWLKSEGDPVEVDETIAELETDKVTVEVNAQEEGMIEKITAPAGSNVEVGGTLGEIKPGKVSKKQKEQKPEQEKATESGKKTTDKGEKKLAPAVRKIVEEKDLSPDDIPATGKGGRLTKEDVINYLEEEKHEPAGEVSGKRKTGQQEERVRMTRLRQRVAQRLKDAQNTAAILTTFNEIDMSAVMNLRTEYKDIFAQKHGVKLGFMSFFINAAVQALKEFPAINAEIDGDEIVYKNYYNIGVAVSAPQGLVVPVINDADQKSMAELEAELAELGSRAREGKIAMEELQGGTFTITNGGVFGSLLSTPILNAPQSGILGMHKIEQRPVVMPDGSIVAKPMMYAALSYDHRIIDGREAVSFLVRVKEDIEDPQRLLLDI